MSSTQGRGDVFLASGADKEESHENWSFLSKLSNDLLVEIFCRLPAKSLVISKCVCKLWCQLITDVCVPRVSSSAPISGLFYLVRFKRGDRRIQTFTYASPGVLHPAREKDELLFKNNMMFMWTLSHAFRVDAFEIDWIDCCNGLILFTRDSIPWYSVYNPTTKQLVDIPRDSAKEEKSVFAALAFHPLEAPNFRVVQFNHWRDSDSLDVFSSETGKWTTHPVSLETEVKVPAWYTRCVYLNGGIYMLSPSKHLLHFDLSEVSVRATAIELPNKDEADVKGGFIGASRDRVYYSNNDGSGSTLFVWVLDDDPRSWVLKHTIHINDFTSDRVLGAIGARPTGSTASWFKVYALDPNSEAIFIGVPTALFRYDVNEETMELVLRPSSNQRIVSGKDSMFTYSPSLVSLKGSRYCDCEPWHV